MRVAPPPPAKSERQWGYSHGILLSSSGTLRCRVLQVARPSGQCPVPWSVPFLRGIRDGFFEWLFQSTLLRPEVGYSVFWKGESPCWWTKPCGGMGGWDLAVWFGDTGGGGIIARTTAPGGTHGHWRRPSGRAASARPSRSRRSTQFHAMQLYVVLVSFLWRLNYGLGVF